MFKFKTPTEREAYWKLKHDRPKTSKNMELIDKTPLPGKGPRRPRLTFRKTRYTLELARENERAARA